MKKYSTFRLIFAVIIILFTGVSVTAANDGNPSGNIVKNIPEGAEAQKLAQQWQTSVGP